MESSPVCIADLEDYASARLPRDIFDYYAGGAGFEQTLRDNCDAFQKYRMRPRYFRDLSNMNTATQLLGNPVDMPICLAPSAMQKMAHPDGEIATARAAEKANTVMILSSISTTSIEDVARSAPRAQKWLQCYLFKNRKVNEILAKRAENSGFSALVLTVDHTGLGKRYRDMKSQFKIPSHLSIANFQDPAIQKHLPENGESKNRMTSHYDLSVTWDKIDWLMRVTSLPVIIKGILTPEAAVEAVEHGVKAIIVSNHGARQLDGVPSTIDVLGEIVRAVKGRCEVYMDGGVRTGTDVIKALALGAKAVFVGRPVLWGLTYKGQDGVIKMLDILGEEFKTAMGLCGCATLDELSPDLLMLPKYQLAKL